MGYYIWYAGMSGLNNASEIGSEINLTDGLQGSEAQKIEDFVANTLLNAQNWQQGKSDPMTSLFSFMVESDDNIGLRHHEIQKGCKH